jgi:hypothetical protein
MAEEPGYLGGRKIQKGRGEKRQRSKSRRQGKASK